MNGLLLAILMLQLVSIFLEVLLYLRLRWKTEESVQILRLIKEWAYSAKTHHSDAKEAIVELKKSASKPGSDEALMTEVKRMPEATADKVVERITESGAHVVAPGK